MKLVTACCMAIIVAVPVTVAAHSGGTDKNGCHINRKTGDRHWSDQDGRAWVPTQAAPPRVPLALRPCAKVSQDMAGTSTVTEMASDASDRDWIGCADAYGLR